jgi:hypothetical protein
LLRPELLPSELMAHIRELLSQKKSAGEQARCVFSADLHAFYERSVQECLEMAAALHRQAPPKAALDALLRKWVARNRAG